MRKDFPRKVLPPRLSMIPLLGPAVCLMAGISLAYFLPVSFEHCLQACGMLLVFAILTTRWPLLQSLSIHVLLVAAGMALCAHRQVLMQPVWPDRQAEYGLVVASSPVVRGKTVVMDALLAESGQKIQLRLMNQSGAEALMIGDGVVVSTHVKPLQATGSYLTYLRCHDYVGEAFAYADHWQRASLSLRQLSSWQRAKLRFLMFRQQLLQHLHASHLDADTYSLVAAMALGDKSAITKEQKDTFSVTGTAHLLALSGLHLSVLYGMLLMLLPRRRFPFASSAFLLLTVWGFVIMVGVPVSIVRAAVMFTVHTVVSLFRRGHAQLNTLCFVTIVMLCANPFALFDVSFQLSITSVLAILLFHPLLIGLLNPSWLRQHKLLGIIGEMTFVSVSAQLGTAPLVAYYFGRFPVYFLLANYLSVPLSTLILYATVVLIVVGWWPAAARLVTVLLNVLVLLLNGWVEWIAALPGASIEGIRFSPLQVVASYVVLGGCFYLLSYYVRHRFVST